MRVLSAAVLLLLPVATQAHEPFLQSSPIQCAAVEALVVYGLIDGGVDGDTSELTEMLGNNDGRACFFALEDYGYAAGMTEDICVAGMEIIAAYGAPEDWELSATEIVSGVLLNDTHLCEELLLAYGS
jgi:hypothetical protein